MIAHPTIDELKLEYVGVLKSYLNLIVAVEEMRKTQKAYYQTSSRYVETKQKLLVQSKAQEQELDKKLATKRKKLSDRIHEITSPTLGL